MLIRDIMSSNLKILYEDQNILDAAKLFEKENIDGAPVLDHNDKLVGLITKRHIIKAFIDNLAKDTSISKIMTRELTTIESNKEVFKAWEKSVGRLPVVDDSKLKGIVTRTDLVNSFYNFSHEILETILESSRSSIVAININGKINTFNKAASELTGISVRKAIGRPIKEIIPESGLLEVLASGKAQITRKFKINDTYVVCNRNPLLKDGEIIGAVGIFQDISDLESISRELKYTRNLNLELDTIIEAVSDGLYITDGEGYTTRINSAYEKITGIKEEEVIGRHMKELVDKGYYSESVTLHVLEEEKPVTITHKIKTGKEVMVTGTPVFDEDGKIVRVVTTVRDMEALSKMREKLEETKELTDRYYNELEQLRMQQLELNNVVVKSSRMRETIDLAIRVGQFNSTILITGESGVGKEIIARVIHKASQSKDNNGSLIKINCGAIPENLLESELFGYEKGAFTGANKSGKPGLFELAENGTLFLDEIGELPINLQVKILRAIQEREIIRVGGTKQIKIKTRLIAATNADLEKLVKEGKFREDLYYRLNVVPILVPPLRERKDDIPPLIYYFMSEYNKKFNTNKKLSLELISFLEKYSWPGNVRQLENTIERLVVMVPDDIITIDHLPVEFKNEIKNNKSIYLQDNIDLREAVDEVEKEMIKKAMEKANTTREIALLLGISQPTVVRKMQKYNLNK